MIIVRGKHSAGKENQGRTVGGKKLLISIDIHITSRNSDIKIMQPVRITTEPPKSIRKRNQFSQFRASPTKVIPKERLKLATFLQ